MTQILDFAASIMQDAEYRTRFTDDTNLLHFEGATILGFVAVYPSTSELLDTWAGHQQAFLESNRQFLRLDPVKAWNVYSILLSTGASDPEQAAAIRQIAEDFSVSRKLTATAVTTRDQVRAALTPILPLTKTTSATDFDPESLLRRKLTDSELHLLDMMNDDRIGDPDIIDWLKAEAP